MLTALVHDQGQFEKKMGIKIMLLRKWVKQIHYPKRIKQNCLKIVILEFSINNSN